MRIYALNVVPAVIYSIKVHTFIGCQILMRLFFRSIISFLFLFVSLARAQDNGSLLEQGNSLFAAGKFSAAIEKYEALLKSEPDNLSARYKLAFALHAAGKKTEALPQLQNVVVSASSAAMLRSSYSLMAGIYDQIGQTEKAIQCYRKAIEVDSTDHSLWYGLGLAYFRSRQYSAAEKSAIEALRLNSGHPLSMRLYALVTFHQNKRAPALLALCSFLWLEPRGNRSAEAWTNIQSILKGGVLKEAPGLKPVALSAETIALNRTIAAAAASVRGRNASQAGVFGEQLKAIVTAIGKRDEKTGDPFFWERLAGKYYQLANSPHFSAFANYIGQKADPAAAAWVKAHSVEIKNLAGWMENRQE